MKKLFKKIWENKFQFFFFVGLIGLLIFAFVVSAKPTTDKPVDDPNNIVENPPKDDPIVEIIEEETPLADIVLDEVPKTADPMAATSAVSSLSALALLGVVFRKRK